MDARQAADLLMEGRMVAICNTYGDVEFVSDAMEPQLQGTATNFYDRLPDALWPAVIAAHEDVLSGRQAVAQRRVRWPSDVPQWMSLTVEHRAEAGTRGHMVFGLSPVSSSRRPTRPVRTRALEQHLA